MMKNLLGKGIKTLGCFAIGLSGTALAQVAFDQDVTPDIIFGSGNSNGGFTTDRENGIEIGLRAKVPYAGILHSNGDGTYSYTLAETAAKGWNFDFTVNTDFDGSSSLKIDQLTYELGLDADPGLGTDFLVFDPITPGAFAPFYDHSIGNNATANGGGTEASDVPGYVNLVTNNNVLQQSWRYVWFPFAPLNAYNQGIPGTYAVYLLARDSGGAVVARSDIQVLIEGSDPVGPKLACEGFKEPLNADVLVKKANRVLPLRMMLFDDLGTTQTDTEISAMPVMQLTYNSGVYGGDANLESIDTAGMGDDGNLFVFDTTFWALNMKTKGLASGNYTITAVSGDLAEYVIDPTCQVNLTVR
jgi:hypothetical protein